MNQGRRRLEHRGVVFEVGPRTPFPGIGWRIPLPDCGDGRRRYEESGGAFYDGCDDHPEGAYAWAEAACRRYIDKQKEDA